MQKLPLKDKIFWKNLFYYIMIFIGACFLFSLGFEEYSEFNLLDGYLITSFICVLWLGFKIAMNFSRNEDLNDLRIKEKLTWEEFRKKYKEIIDIYE